MKTKSKSQHLIIRLTLIGIGGLFVLWMILMQQRFSSQLLHNIPAIVGLVMMFTGMFWPWLGWLRKIFMPAIILYVGTFLLMCIFIFTHAQNTPASGHDAVIVLGAGLVGDNQIPRILRYRLDTALIYLHDNEDTLAVVTGGLGQHVTVTEAYAMGQYLIQHGIAPERIILEDQSTSTMENLNFAKALLDERLGENNYTIVLVTNDFHLPRGRMLVRRAGLAGEGMAAPTQRGMVPRYYSREHLAISWAAFTWFLPYRVFYWLQ
ncbi:MAG: YdcF family protein [Defluviitaleaceae bacterium]|nr:YdcF family protein [Defluviitaleaceae bacterium]